jgi:hypothetical protein
VVGGVVGGVSGGVVGGVMGGAKAEHPEIAPAEATSQGTAQTEAQRREAAKVEAAKREAQLEEVQKALKTLERERLESRLKRQLEESSAELETLEREYRRSKQLVEKGLLNSSDLARLEASMRLLQNKIAAARLEHELEAREMDLRAVESRRQAELARTIAEYEQVKDKYALSIDDYAVAARDRLLLLRETVEVDQAEPIRAGDVLVIEIRGEPDVPRAYSVQENGMIRLPLSPPLRVQGMTVQQVAQDLAKQLTARGLDQPAVDVKLRRHRAPEGQ